MWHWHHTQGSDWANHPGQSLLHKWSHLQRNRSCTHTCTSGHWSGWCRYIRHICGNCGSCPCMGSLAHTPKEKTGQVELYYEILSLTTSNIKGTGCDLTKKKDGPPCPCHQSLYMLLLLSAFDDMLKSRVVILPLFLVASSLEGHPKLRASPKPKCRALLGRVDFMKSYLMHHTSHNNPLFPLLQHKVFTANTHYQRMNITAVWMPLHELIEERVTARTGLWSKL